MADIIRYGAIMLVTAGVIAAWQWLSRRMRPVVQEGDSGTITPGKVSALLVVVFGVALVLFGIAALAAGDVAVGVILVAVGMALAVFMAPSLTHLHDVSWSEQGVQGPCKMFGPSLGVSRTFIGWDEISRTGKTLTDYWFVEAYDGRRVYWSYLYRGYGALIDDLKRRRPDLPLSAGL